MFDEPQKPKGKVKKFLESKGYNTNEWMVMSEDVTYLTVVHKESGVMEIVDKSAK